ncbi:MAG: BMP family ABC transporter substrate-binding protein [Nocardioidaceae bacterium]
MDVRGSSIRFRWAIAGGLATSLLAAGCGNDDSASTDPTSSPAPASSSGGESSGEETPSGQTETTESGGADPAAAAVTLEELCASDYADVKAPAGFKAGLVTDVGTVNDGSFNQFAYEGLKAAEDCFGVETDFIETANQADYNNNLTTILTDKPDVVITTGFLLADATLTFAKENPAVSWVGIDQFQESYPGQLRGHLVPRGPRRISRRRTGRPAHGVQRDWRRRWPRRRPTGCPVRKRL